MSINKRISQRLLLIMIFSCITIFCNAQVLKKITDIFFKRYTDYPQLFQDMAFTIGDWDAIEKVLHDEIVILLNNSYKIYPVSGYFGDADPLFR